MNYLYFLLQVSDVGGPTPGQKFCTTRAWGATDLSARNWHCLTMTYDTHVISAYVNGTLDSWQLQVHHFKYCCGKDLSLIITRAVKKAKSGFLLRTMNFVSYCLDMPMGCDVSAKHFAHTFLFTFHPKLKNK